MKKVFILTTILFCVLMISFSIYYKKTEKVLVAGELIAFEIEENEEKITNEEYINTSFKELGIVTYINPETNQFAALGHSLTNNKDGKDINGLCYEVEFENNKSVNNIYFNEEKPVGTVYYDNYSGIYGQIDNVAKNKYTEVETMNRYNIKKGKANILINLEGEKLESFEVEIVAINYFDSNKNIRIKITDERLINKTGGIVQGMSGTPVMQDGKLIGAINCVNAKDSLDAFAIFIDKLI